MRRKIIMVSFFAIFIVLMSIGVKNHYAINIKSDDEIKQVLQNYMKASGEVEIIKKVVDQNECFILYKDEGEIALGILSKTYLSFNKYYKEFGGSKNGPLGTYNISFGGTENEILLVAYGITSELENRKFRVNFNEEENEIEISKDDEYFLNIFRHSSERHDSWGRIEY